MGRRPHQHRTYPGARFRRLHRWFGKQGGGKAAVAIAYDLIVIAWHVLHDGVEFYDLGPDYFTRPDSPAHSRRKDHLMHELQALGYTIQVTPPEQPHHPIPAALRSAGKLPPARAWVQIGLVPAPPRPCNRLNLSSWHSVR